MIKNINPGSASSDPQDITAVGNAIYFVANDGVNSRKLWKTEDDTTFLVKVPSFFNAATLSQITVMNGEMYFNANSAIHGTELWVAYDDKAVLIKDINPGTETSLPLDLEVVNNLLYFVANDGTIGRELWSKKGNNNYPTKKPPDFCIP